MKLLLTSAGIKNAIHYALVDLLGKPIAESNALCIPTAGYGHPWPVLARGMAFHQRTLRPAHVRAGVEVLGRAGAHRAAQHRRERWVPWVRETDVLLVNGGDALYLGHWMRQSGLADLLPSLQRDGLRGFQRREHGDDPPDRGGLRRLEAARRWRRSTLGVVDFSIFPHVDHPDLPENTMAEAERWAAGLGGPAYAIDDDTAIQVVDGTVEVVSEGHWKLFTPSAVARESSWTAVP